MIKNGIVNVKESTFLGKKALISKFNRNTYFGKCSNCHEMCGVLIKPKEVLYPTKKGTIKQLKLFNKNA